MRKQLNLSLNKNEFNLIQNNAQYLGMKPTTYVKSLALNQSLYIPKISHEETKNIYQELHHIGINLNQIAKQLNQHHLLYSDEIQMIKDIQERIIQLWDHL